MIRSLVGTVVIVWLAPTPFLWPRFERARARALLGMGMRVQAVELLSAVRDQVLVIGAAALGGLVVVAYYNVIVRVLQVPGLLLVALLRVSFPAMAQVHASGGDAKRMLPRILTTSAIGFGADACADRGSRAGVRPLLLGARWEPAGAVLPLVCLGAVVWMPLTIGCQGYLWATGDASSPLRAMFADAFLFLAVGLPLVPYLGVLGMAIGLVVAAFAHSAVLGRAVRRLADVSAARAVGVPILVWIIATAVAWVCAETAGPLIVRTIVSAGVAFVLFFTLLLPTHHEQLREMAGHVSPVIRGGLRRRSARSASPATT